MSEVDEVRLPPHDELAEQSVLGGLMLSKSALFDVVGTLEAPDFYNPRHEVIFTAILALVALGEPVDAISVGDQLTKTGQTGRAGGVDYLHQLTSAVPTAANAGFYGGIVKDRAVKRRLVEAGMRITNMGYASEGEGAELAETARAELDAATGNAGTDIVTIGRRFNALVDELSSRPRYVETPWREINEYIGGLRPGGLYVVGARPGEGKTIMGLQMAQQLALSGPVAFSSLEMSTEQLLTRLVSLRAKVHMSPLSRHELGKEDWERIAAARPDIYALPLYVDDRSGLNITQIKAFARSVQRKGQLAGVVVDYLQLITGGDRNKARYEVVGEISRQLKILARELECPVIALSQLNRESVGKQKRAPTPADLRESGSIEQDADVVMLLQRQLDEDDKPGDRLNVYVAKNRHGKTGMRTLLWEGQYARLTSQRWGYAPELPIRD